MSDDVENTMRELESILNDLEPDASRLRVFINQKTSRKPQVNQQFLLAVPDISFDIGVDLVRHPTQKEAKPKQSAKVRDRQLSCYPLAQDRVADSQPQHENGRTFSMPLQRSLSLSPSMARSRVGGSPLKKCTRNTVLKNSNVECISTPSPSPMSFKPAVSSTPALVSKPIEKQSPKDGIPTPVMDKNGQAVTADDFENSYLTYMQITKGIPLSPPNKSQKLSTAVEQDLRHSFSLKNETGSSHLKATQEKGKTIRERKLKVRLKRTSLIKKQSVIEIAKELDKFSGIEQHDMPDSAAVPDPVSAVQEKPAPANSPPATLPDSPPALSATSPPTISHTSPAKSQSSTSVLATTSRASPPALSPEPKAQLVVKALGSAPRLTEVVSAAPKPTSTSPAASTSCGIQNSCFLPDTHQKKEGADSLIPLHMKLPGGGKAATQQLQTPTVNEHGHDDDELALNLDKYRSKNLTRTMTNMESAKSVLNKPSHPEMNGQEFPKELAKIVDLRKRNSRGLVNGQLSEDQQIVEILRRKLEENETSFIKDTVNKKRKNRKRPVLMSQELMHYMSLTRTIQLRMKNSTSSCSKRSLYTKGDSDNDLSSPSPTKQSRICDPVIHIAPSPPSVSPCIEEVFIAPAPPVSIRFSQQISTKGKTSITFQEEPAASLEHPLATTSIDALPIVSPPPVSLQLKPSKVKLGCNFGKDDSEQAAVSLEEPLAIPCLDALPIVNPPSASSNCNSGKDVTDQLATNAVAEPNLPIEENTVEAEDQSISEHMEPLRVQSTSPPPLDDQPSTSHAARKAFEHSLIKATKTIKKKTKENKSKDNVYKPHNSKKGEEEDDNITIRRSKRGHIPLRNDFCHTLSDPFRYMREIELGAGVSKTLKRKRNASSHKQVEKRVKEQATVTQHKKQTLPERQASPEQQAVMEPEQEAVMEPEKEAEMEPKQVEEPQPQNEISPLFSWLRGVSNIPPKSLNQVAPQFESMSISPAADLNFCSLENVDYAFYLTEGTCTLGYMRLQPYQQRGFKRNKTNNLNFVAIYGKFGIEVEKAEAATERYVINAGDMVDIKIGCRFNIVNRLNEVGLLLVTRIRGS